MVFSEAVLEELAANSATVCCDPSAALSSHLVSHYSAIGDTLWHKNFTHENNYSKIIIFEKIFVSHA